MRGRICSALIRAWSICPVRRRSDRVCKHPVRPCADPSIRGRQSLADETSAEPERRRRECCVCCTRSVRGRTARARARDRQSSEQLQHIIAAMLSPTFPKGGSAETALVSPTVGEDASPRRHRKSCPDSYLSLAVDTAYRLAGAFRHVRHWVELTRAPTEVGSPPIPCVTPVL